ncbi:MAG: xanthine dehydrogenase family protein molybdopterin-binding subunit [Gracilibacteraceae bacterium]|nr:xanthine dehydrogenase family protein molybdopterin-binding subunit [Gracilibacteraceae bacterium]
MDSDFDYEIENQDFSAIGKRGIWRIDGREKASGSAIYTADIKLPGMLYARVFNSPYPHAGIKSMDTSKVEAFPGVRAVLRSDDPEIKDKVVPGSYGAPWYVLPDWAMWEGEPIGLVVAADSEQICDEALKLVEIDWDIRPFITDIEDAQKPGAPELHNKVPNDIYDAVNENNPYASAFSELFRIAEGHRTFEQGSVKKGFAEADKIIEFKARRRMHTWAQPEIPSAICRWNGGYPEIWVKHQHAYEHKQVMPVWFDVPMNKVTLHVPYQGAMFGGWNWMNWSTVIHYISALLSKRTGKPVKLCFNRRDDFYGGALDCGTYEFKVGAKKDGTITAVAIKSDYVNGPTAAEANTGIYHFIENSRIPNLFKENNSVVVNRGPVTAVRCEQLANTLCFNMVFSHVAAELGLDPTEVALKNDGYDGEDSEYLTECKKRFGKPQRDSLRECIEAGKKAIDWDNKWHTPGTRKLPNGKMHGIGFVWTHEWNSKRGAGTVGVLFEPDGSVSLMAQRADTGLCAETAYCQIAADELGMRYEDVFLNSHKDSGFAMMTPDGSCNLCTNGWVIRRACRKAKRKLLEFAALGYQEEFHSYPPAFEGCGPEDLDVKDSVIFVKANPAISKTVKEVVKEVMCVQWWKHPQIYDWSWKQTGAHVDPTGEASEELIDPNKRPHFCRQAHFMEVEVDPETGEIEVTNVVCVNDVGKAINPEGVQGQQYGGVYMAVGRGKHEEVILDEPTGVMLNGNLLDYKITTILDCGPIDPIIVETAMGYGPYGANGIGENVADLTSTLLGPAVYNALGVAVDDFPITPAKILKALGKI